MAPDTLPATRSFCQSEIRGRCDALLDHDGGFGITGVAFAGKDELITSIHRLPGEKAPTVLLWKLP